MNRRALLRKAVGAGAAVAALPVLEKVAEARLMGDACGSSCTPVAAPHWTPPPPDTRTPEQVIADQDSEHVENVIRHLTRDPDPWNRRYAYSIWNHEFDAVLATLHERRIVVEERKINGVDCIIGPNGNLVRRLGQPLYIHHSHSA